MLTNPKESSPRGEPQSSTSVSHPITLEIVDLFNHHGASRYGGEAVSQLEHALQAAHFAEQSGANASLISAALLHDIGHLLHDLPEDAPDHGVDDCHEDLGGNWLRKRFSQAVVEPVQLHVAAKRYLCTVDPEYISKLSQPSIDSLKLQGGLMSDDERAAFERHRYYREALQLRRWDDEAKIVGLTTAPLSHFAQYLDQAQQA